MELKNGETYNGNLASVDAYMNLSLKDVICTSKDGARFWRLPEALVRGPAIKYLRIPEDVLDHMPADDAGLADSGAYAGAGGAGARMGGGGCVAGGRPARHGPLLQYDGAMPQAPLTYCPLPSSSSPSLAGVAAAAADAAAVVAAAAAMLAAAVKGAPAGVEGGWAVAAVAAAAGGEAALPAAAAAAAACAGERLGVRDLVISLSHACFALVSASARALPPPSCSGVHPPFVKKRSKAQNGRGGGGSAGKHDDRKAWRWCPSVRGRRWQQAAHAASRSAGGSLRGCCTSSS